MRKRTIFGRLALAVFTILSLGTLAILALDTQPGRELLARQLVRMAPDSGLRVHVGRLEGSIYGDLIIRDLQLSDPDGVFLTSPRVRLHWHPRDYLFRNRLDIDDLSARRVNLLRLPKLRPTSEPRSLLPSFDIDISRVEISSLHLGEAVAGRPHIARLSGRLLTRGDRAHVSVGAASATGGDQLRLLLDAIPDADRFALQGRLRAPANGVLSGIGNIDRGLVVDLNGKGRWTYWQGTLRAQLLPQGLPDEKTSPLANLTVDAARGRFRLSGRLDPAQAVGGLLDRLVPDGIQVEASAAPDGNRIPFILAADADSFALKARGATDRKLGDLFDAQADIALLHPPSLIRTLTGGNIRLNLSAAGPLTAPEASYRLTADWFALGDQRIDDLVVEGELLNENPDADFSASATFTRLRGAGDLVERLSEGAQVAGPLTLDGLLVSGRRTKVKTRMLSASADFSLDLRTGRYDVVGDMDLPAYPIPGLGQAAVDGRLRLRPDPIQPRKLRISGPVSARLTRLDNEFLRFVFGGLPRGRADIVRTPDGTIALSNTIVTAPDLNIRGSGYYRLGQQIDFTGRGVQRRFGSMKVALDGDISRPQALVHVDSYNLGLPIENIDARFDPSADRYDFTATGSTFLGPVTAAGLIDTTPDAVQYRLERVALAGVTAAGTLTPTGGVPVSGTLTITGAGVDGTARFSAQGETQRIAIAAGARTASFDLDPAVAIRRGTVRSELMITPQGNKTTGSFDLAGVGIGTLALASANGTFRLEDGEGHVEGKVQGRRGLPFALDMAADIAGNTLSVSAAGNVAGDPIRLAAPARLIRDDTGRWQLSAVKLNLPSGTAIVSGALDGDLDLQAEFNRAGLGVLQLALPSISLSGTATGKIDLNLSAHRLPRGRASFQIVDFTRQSGVLAQPVDIALIAIVDSDSAALRAAFEQDGRRIGRFQARLPSIPDIPGNVVQTRIANAPVEGQLRFRGPAEAIWPLTGIDAIGVTGPLAARIDIGGTVGNPQLQGALRSWKLGFESVASGTVIDDIVLDGRFAGSRLILEEFTGRDRDGGAISGTGTVDLSLARGFPIDVTLNAQRAALVDIDTLETRVTGPINIINDPERGARISGDLDVDRARYTAGNQLAEQIPVLNVREINTDLVRMRSERRAETVWQLDVQTKANNRLYVRGLGLDSEWSAGLRLGGPVTQPRLTGTAKLVRGDYDFAGRRFELTSGEVRFGGAYPPDPVLNIRAESRVEGLTAQINIRGLSSQPEVRLSSVPALPEDEILSRVLFGTSISNLSAPEALQLAGAIAALQNGGQSALDPIGSVRRAIGIDRLRIGAADAATGRGTGVAAGEYLGRRTYVEVSTNTEGVTATEIEFALTRAFSLLGRVATFGGSSVGVRVSTDY